MPQLRITDATTVPGITAGRLGKEDLLVLYVVDELYPHEIRIPIEDVQPAKGQMNVALVEQRIREVEGPRDQLRGRVLRLGG